MTSDFIASVKYAGMTLSCISAVSSFVVVFTYLHMLLKFRAHQKRILETSDTQQQQKYQQNGAHILNPTTALLSCESSFATPGYNGSFLSLYQRQQQRGSAQQTSNPGMPTSMRFSANSQDPRHTSANQRWPSNDNNANHANGSTSGGVVQAKQQSSGPTSDTLSDGHNLKRKVNNSAMSLASGKMHAGYRRLAGMFSRCSPASKTPLLDKANGTAQPSKTSSQGEDRPKQAQRKKIPRIPSSKIAMISAIDLLLHAFWIINATATTDDASCNATLFFYQWIQLFYLFFLSTFVLRSAIRLRDLQPTIPQDARKMDVIYSFIAVICSLVLSLLPAIMTNAQYDSSLGLCWFPSGGAISLRWVWISFNTWIVAAVFFLVGTSIYISVILLDQHRDLRRFSVRTKRFYPLLTPALESQFTQTTNPASPKNNTAFGFRSTPLSTKDSMQMHNPSSYIQHKKYPSTHPVALAHEALHGRRPAGTQTREPSIRSARNRYSSSLAAGLSRQTIQNPCGVHAKNMWRSSAGSCKSSLSSCAVCQACCRRQSGSSHSSCELHHLRALRHNSDIVTARQLPQHQMQHSSAVVSRRQMAMKGDDSSSAGSSPASMIYRYPRPSTAALGYMGGNSTINGSESSRIASLHAWDSNRHLLGNPQYSPAAKIIARQASRHTDAPDSTYKGRTSAGTRPSTADSSQHKHAAKGQATKYHVWFNSLKGNEYHAKGRGSSKKQAAISSSHLQRVENRVKLLVATGALRVATRALVPLLTQLCIVIWSTIHAVGMQQDSQEISYAIAVILLSLQGTLDMVLYYVFDTRVEEPDTGLPNHFPQASNLNLATVTSNSSNAYIEQQNQVRPPSLAHLRNGVHSTKRTSAGAQLYSSHCSHHGLGIQCENRRISGHYQFHETSGLVARPQTPSFARLPYSKRPLSRRSADTGHGSNGEPGMLEQKFMFNTDSLNICKASRTSNAMQSDTLNGSEHIEWSQMDSCGISMHCDTTRASQYSGTGAQHRRSMVPVLSGWEEVELEDA